MPTMDRRRSEVVYVARVRRDGTTFYLGRFPTFEEAYAEEEAFATYHPAQSRGNRPRRTTPEPRVSKPYQARRYRGKMISLGYYATPEEARAAEAAFDARNPRGKPGPKGNPYQKARNAHQ